MPRWLIFALATLATGLALGTALLLGSGYFDAQRFSAHEGRLRRLVGQAPQLEQVLEALQADGSPLVSSPRGPAELERLAARFPGRRGAEILEKGRSYPTVRVFHASDVYYVLFFDAQGVLRDFACVDA